MHDGSGGDRSDGDVSDAELRVRTPNADRMGGCLAQSVKESQGPILSRKTNATNDGQRLTTARAGVLAPQVSEEERKMMQKIDPEAMQPTTMQSFDYSDRNPVVNELGEGGGQIAAPEAAESRVTPEGPEVSADEGLQY